MIIIQTAGGLGNQLQQYALYRKFLYLGKEAKLDISWFTQGGRQDRVSAGRTLELNRFNRLEYEACTETEKRKLTGGRLTGKIREKLFPGQGTVFYESEIYHPEVFTFQDKYLSGYWACEKYYADILEDLRTKIVFPEPTGENATKNQELALRLEKETSVSLHIRRGDYLDLENRRLFGNICTEAYYEGAIRLLKERCPEARFYLFSDDMEYVKEKYSGREYFYVDWNRGGDSFYDMWLMSRCNHHICANSTFSFWGARLDPKPEKIMIRPTLHKNTQSFEPDRMHELWREWIFVDNQGKVQGRITP